MHTENYEQYLARVEMILGRKLSNTETTMALECWYINCAACHVAFQLRYAA